MERTESCKIQLQVTRTCCFFLLLLVFALGACSFPVQPRYQPISDSSMLSVPRQGYRDIPIDERTYLILYDNYYRASFNVPILDPHDDRWLKGAQEYVLYRAGELAQSKGAHRFVVLYKDDWNLIGIFPQKNGRRPSFQPGAAIVMRVLTDDSFSIQENDDRVFAVDQLLRDLPEMNGGLAEYQNRPSQVELIQKTEKSFNRWRSSVSGYDSGPVLKNRAKQLIDYALSPLSLFRPETIITKKPTGGFEIVIWDDSYSPTLSIELLRQCAVLAEQEGFEVFKLEDWTVEEHRDNTPQGGIRKVWFRTTANVVLQHQKQLDSLDPVFVVDEIRQNVMNNK